MGWKTFIDQNREQQGGVGPVLRKIQNFKKSDWAVIALVGILLLVIAMPLSNDDEALKTESRENAAESDTGEVKYADDRMAGMSENTGAVDQETYVAYLEGRLKAVLSRMDGVGDVEVMITVLDAGEAVVEKDTKSSGTITEESDSAGGSRKVSDQDAEEQTVYVETGDESYPYVQKEKLPTIGGVVVVAEGGGSPVVVSDISEAVKALLQVEAHRIKVVKMCSKEE